MQELNARQVPDEIAGRPRIVGSSSHTECLYSYIRKIGQQLFTPSFFKQLFPNELSTRKSIIVQSYQKKSKLPQARSISENLKTGDLNLTPVFETFKKLAKTNLNQIIAISDFCILYCTFVILVTSNDGDNELQALYFLKQLLHIEIPLRISEDAILFAVLVKQGDSPPKVRGHSIQALASLAEHDNSIIPRLEAGSIHHDTSLASLCKEALSSIDKTHLQPQEPTLEFILIPSDASEETVYRMLTNFETLIQSGQLPPDSIKFNQNVIQSLKNHITSPRILEKGSNILKHTLYNNENTVFPLEMISDVLSFCFSILSGELFLNGDTSFEAIESIQELSNIIFSNTPPDVLLNSICTSIATSSDSVANLLLDKLKEYLKYTNQEIPQNYVDDLINSIDAFHPTLTKPSFLARNGNPIYNQLEESIRNLFNSETVFEEMERIISLKNPDLINSYPMYLRGFLQRAYLLYNGVEIEGINETQRIVMNEMLRNYRNMSENDIKENGKFGVNTLKRQLDDMNELQAQSW
ncbi:hypothetical protein GPJ56_006294 [Histomonas meleagridis]|uniref:uncharacterized protein n=1 Tax=Histomonas meleagridis TaxID=135588 RepID=UPI00355A28C4|nr:hypothetical protein GPJ56_006294 [Histomonas meleagridis]KAH0796889.1 hypothetical protein GO595_010782 [Histomonas meleagridis]